MSDERRTPPSDLTVQEAVDRYLARTRRDKTESTVETYRLDLRQFVQWCDAEGIKQVSDLTGYDFELYEGKRAEELAPKSLENQMRLVQRFIRFCEDIEAVEEGLSEKVHIPVAPPESRSSDVMLDSEDARELLQHFRDKSNGLYGTKWHALLEVAWHTGARLGGLQALDLDDYDREALALEFRHRPKTGTPLKNKLKGERDVGILPKISEVLGTYIEEHRHDRRDEHGRVPLFTTRSTNGRLSDNALRSWMYQATQPCWHTDDPCPHDKVRGRCDWTNAAEASKCPSSQSPHAVRTGSITFHRDQGYSKEVVSDRVNASLRVIERHYDKADRRRELEQRRREQVNKLSLDTHDQQN